MTLQEILESVKSGSVSVEEAERILKEESYEEMGYAKLDTSRKARTGFAEVIYCSNKADEHLLNIFERLYREDGDVFGTRASQHQYELVKEKFPETEYDPISRILKVEKKDKKRIGKIAVCSAGTADIPVLRKLHRQRNILAQMLNGFMMWESADSTGSWPAWTPFRKPTASLRWRAWKGPCPVCWEAW